MIYLEKIDNKTINKEFDNIDEMIKFIKKYCFKKDKKIWILGFILIKKQSRY